MSKSNLNRYAVVGNGIVINIIEYEPTAQIGDGLEDSHTAIASDTAQIGWSYDGVQFIDTTPPIKPVILPLPQQAFDALAMSDKVAWRCLKAGVPYPANWHEVDIQLRDIVSGKDTTSTELPSFPLKVDGFIDYPAGT